MTITDHAKPAPWTIEEVPPREDGSSRFARPTLPGGWGSKSAETIAHVYRELADQRLKQAPLAAPAPVEIELGYVAKTDTGYELIPRGSVFRAPTRVNQRPGRRVRPTLKGGAAIDSFLLGPGQEAWDRYPDDLIWKAVLELAEEAELDGRALRVVNDSLAVAICARRGVEVLPEQLPHPFPASATQEGS
jgi:hypothetical protein